MVAMLPPLAVANIRAPIFCELFATDAITVRSEAAMPVFRRVSLALALTLMAMAKRRDGHRAGRETQHQTETILLLVFLGVSLVARRFATLAYRKSLHARMIVNVNVSMVNVAAASP